MRTNRKLIKASPLTVRTGLRVKPSYADVPSIKTSAAAQLDPPIQHATIHIHINQPCHRAPADLENPKNPNHPPEVAVHLDLAALVGLDTNVLEAQISGEGAAPGADQHNLSLQRLACNG